MSITTPVFNGTAEAGATVSLLAGGTTLGSAKVGNAGNWSTTSNPLADGKYAVVARVTDLAGNNSAFSAALPVSIDNAAPAAPLSPRSRRRPSPVPQRPMPRSSCSTG